jgi:hypothetical protein
MLDRVAGNRAPVQKEESTLYWLYGIVIPTHAQNISHSKSEALWNKTLFPFTVHFFFLFLINI